MLTNGSARWIATSLFIPAFATVLAVSAVPALAGPIASLSRTIVAFDHIGVQRPSSVQPVFVTNTGDAPLTISGLTIGARSPAPAAAFIVAGTCTPPLTLPPNARCRVDLTVYDANETFYVGGYSSHATFSLQSDSSVPAPDVALTTFSVFDLGAFEAPRPTPEWIDFPALPLGAPAAEQTLSIANIGTNNLGLVSIGLAGGNSSEFTLTSSTCVAGVALAPGTNCQAMIAFQPTASGPRATELQLNVKYAAPGLNFNATYPVSITGVGGPTGPGPIVTVVEFYNAGLDHYFITYGAQEISDLDTGVHKGWARTGYSFNAYTAAQAGTSPVCRFYIPPALGDSHFFGRGTAECDATGQKNPTFVNEDPAFMQMFLPVAGVCPAGTIEIYRVFSNRPDANHRYMTDKALRQMMVDKGWLAEGDGPNLVVMCAPT